MFSWRKRCEPVEETPSTAEEKCQKRWEERLKKLLIARLGELIPIDRRPFVSDLGTLRGARLEFLTAAEVEKIEQLTRVLAAENSLDGRIETLQGLHGIYSARLDGPVQQLPIAFNARIARARLVAAIEVLKKLLGGSDEEKHD